MSSVAEASARRLERMAESEIDKRIDLLLANVTLAENPADRYHAVTANPRKMGYLRFLLKHYAKSSTPWRDCYKDNFPRIGDKAKGLCGVLKDVLRGQASWRGHPEHDAGSPGVAIGEADAGAAPAWGGRKHLADTPSPCLQTALATEFGEVDEIALEGAVDLLVVLQDQCDVFRVLVGLDDPPHLNLSAVRYGT